MTNTENNKFEPPTEEELESLQKEFDDAVDDAVELTKTIEEQSANIKEGDESKN